MTTSTAVNFKFIKVRAGEYVADVLGLHIEIDREPEEYFPWSIYISRKEVSVDPRVNASTHIYSSYARTFREAKDMVRAYIEAHDILSRI